MNNYYVPSEMEASKQFNLKATNCMAEKKWNSMIARRYLNLEPSLAMDWLEISWDELDIKEQIGAGIFCWKFFIEKLFSYSSRIMYMSHHGFMLLMKIVFRFVWNCLSC